MFLHVFYSWLLTQIIHPFLFILFFYITDGPHEAFFTLNPGDIMLLGFISSIASLPCLLFGWLFLGIIIYSNYTVTLKFLFWILVTAILVVLNFWILILVLNDGDAFLNHEEFELAPFLIAIPGIASIWFASMIRISQFRNLNKKQINPQETNIV